MVLTLKATDLLDWSEPEIKPTTIAAIITEKPEQD